MRIPEHIVEQVRDGADILGVVEDYVRMKKAGNNYIGLCPFHEEKTASFNVSPSRGYFKCFGCGKGGNVITFVMEIERLDFLDAVRWLADRMGIEIPVQVADQEEFKKKETIYNALRFAAEYYVKKLQESTIGLPAREYLEARGLTDKTAERFKLGYAPDSWSGLLEAAQTGHIEPETLLKAGLVAERDNGRGYYDRFRNRIMFPIWSHVGKIIGFGGRALADAKEGTPKYLNTPETEVYHKSYVLYGLFQAKRVARQQDKILLVEGYTDVLALDQAGIGSIACCGTALTPQQVQLLGRFVKEIQLLYDADTAGVDATERAVDVVLQNGLDASVVSLPEGEDPDSFVRSQGADQFRAYLQTTTKDWIESLYLAADGRNTLSTLRGKLLELSRISERISWLQDQLLKKLYIKRASQLFGVLEGDIWDEVNRYLKGNQTSGGMIPSQSEELDPTEEIPEAEKMLLQLMLEEGAPMIEYILRHMSLDEFSEGASQNLVEAIIDLYHEHQRESLTAIQGGQLRVNEQTQQLVANLLMRQHEVSRGWGEKKIVVPKLNQDAKRIAIDCMRESKRKHIGEEMDELLNQILNSEQGGEDQLKLQEKYRQKSQLLRDLQKVEIFGD
ncbi:MAG: DNA primase [Bacteroidetes bacterium]|nr:DNA primase [Bacteroidota bacterium]MCY4206297.1 DNA primase [Bacteroidota bacterium]